MTLAVDYPIFRLEDVCQLRFQLPRYINSNRSLEFSTFLITPFNFFSSHIPPSCFIHLINCHLHTSTLTLLLRSPNFHPFITTITSTTTTTPTYLLLVHNKNQRIPPPCRHYAKIPPRPPRLPPVQILVRARMVPPEHIR